MSSIQERIKDLIEKKGLNKNSFSNMIGIQPQTLHHIVSGRMTKPSFEVIQKIVSTFSDINPAWLITGEGDMFCVYKYTPENTPVHTPESAQKSPPNEKGSFKQTLNTGPPAEQKECEKCKEKDQIIETQKITIRTQQDNIYTKSELIETLKEKIEELTQKSGGQKRKAS